MLLRSAVLLMAHRADRRDPEVDHGEFGLVQQPSPGRANTHRRRHHNDLNGRQRFTLSAACEITNGNVVGVGSGGYGVDAVIEGGQPRFLSIGQYLTNVMDMEGDQPAGSIILPETGHKNLYAGSESCSSAC
ncbi:MAG TPA: hypothetical protein VFQ44_12060 [Streptosporangiaceae bacterium]|nr:hypothetical protein [Streptosporangiaceae bacterium]